MFRTLPALCIACVVNACSAQSPEKPRGALLESSSVVATAGKPAVLQIQISAPQPAGSQLELKVAASKIQADEAFVVVVSEVGGAGQELGTFSFYPPPLADQERTFVVDAPAPATEDAKTVAQLKVTLVPVNPNAAPTTELKVLSARFVEDEDGSADEDEKR